MSVRKHLVQESEKPTLIDLNDKGALSIHVFRMFSSISFWSSMFFCPPCVNFVFRSAFLIITKWLPIATRTLCFTFHIQMGRECHFSLSFVLIGSFLHLCLQQGGEWVFPDWLGLVRATQRTRLLDLGEGGMDAGKAIPMSISSCFWAGQY